MDVHRLALALTVPTPPPDHALTTLLLLLLCRCTLDVVGKVGGRQNSIAVSVHTREQRLHLETLRKGKALSAAPRRRRPCIFPVQVF